MYSAVSVPTKLRRFRIVLAALLVCLAGASLARASEIAGPHFTAEQIRNARDARSAEELRIEAVGTRRALEGGDASAKGNTTTWEIGLGSDYVRVRSRTSEQVFDFRIRRFLSIDPQNRAFVNMSLSALVGFRGYEAVHRQNMTKAMSKVLGKEGAAKIPLENSDPFWRSTQLGITAGDDAKTAPSFDTRDGGWTVSTLR